MKDRRNTVAFAAFAGSIWIGYLAAESNRGVVHYERVDELASNPEPWLAEPPLTLEPWLARPIVQVGGYVAPGSIEGDVLEDGRAHQSFELTGRPHGGEAILVRHTGIVRAGLVDRAEAAAMGTLIREHGRLVLLALDDTQGLSTWSTTRSSPPAALE